MGPLSIKKNIKKRNQVLILKSCFETPKKKLGLWKDGSHFEPCLSRFFVVGLILIIGCAFLLAFTERVFGRRNGCSS
jgi:hypothetical protein